MQYYLQCSDAEVMVMEFIIPARAAWIIGGMELFLRIESKARCTFVTATEFKQRLSLAYWSFNRLRPLRPL